MKGFENCLGRGMEVIDRNQVLKIIPFIIMFVPVLIYVLYAMLIGVCTTE